MPVVEAAGALGSVLGWVLQAAGNRERKPLPALPRAGRINPIVEKGRVAGGLPGDRSAGVRTTVRRGQQRSRQRESPIDSVSVTCRPNRAMDVQRPSIASKRRVPAQSPSRREARYRNPTTAREEATLASDSKETRDRAEASFKKQEQRAREGAKAMADYEVQGRATRARTARLKSLRMAQQAGGATLTAQNAPAAAAVASTAGELRPLR